MPHTALERRVQEGAQLVRVDFAVVASDLLERRLDHLLGLRIHRHAREYTGMQCGNKNKSD